jgi:5-methylcytosine-specific restriction endonuclease McrA
MEMKQDWRDVCAKRMTQTLARNPRRGKTRAYLATLPKRKSIVVSPDEYVLVSRHDARLNQALQKVRDAQRYADWERRGKPPSPSLPRKDRVRPRARPELVGQRIRLHDAQDGLCGLCGYTLDLREGTLDHVVPRARGGQNVDNLLLAHARCNNEKADRMPTKAELAMLALVNERLARHAIEARRVETAGLDAKHESAVPVGQTPTLYRLTVSGRI